MTVGRAGHTVESHLPGRSTAMTENTWQTPDYDVIEVSLEATAYLMTR